MYNFKVVQVDFIELVKALAKDIGLSREDLEYVIRRYNSEGLRFLTFTLPSLSKAVVHSLEVGEFIRPTDFAWKRKSLFFMNSFLSKIFDPSTGKVLDDACPYSIRSVRQFCEYFYKLALETSVEAKVQGEENYTKNEEVVASFDFDDTWVESLRKNLETYYKRFCNTDINSVLTSHRPRFGPGSFAPINWSEESPTVFKKLSSDIVGVTRPEFAAISGYFKSYPSSSENIEYSPADGKTSVVTFVAKDSRGPRVISMEPVYLLKLQMSYLDWSIKTLQSETDGRIQFEDQSKNNQHAKMASTDRTMATLDLKDASDRVSYDLMRRVFSNTLAPRYFLQNARSTHTLLPSGKVIPLKKVAGMGSGLTFPTMSLLIHLSICTHVSARLGVPYNKVMRSVYVYGDDVIVPTSWYNFAITALTRSGLLVNKDKSFFRGFFRESCGGDYFKGVSNTPVKLRLDKVGLRSVRSYKNGLILNNSRQIYKLNAHTRELLYNGMIQTKKYYDSLLRSTLIGYYPKVTGESPLLGEYTESIVVKDDVPVKAFTLEPVVSKHKGFCPYKHLGNSLTKVKPIHRYDVFKDKIAQTFLALGEYVRPGAMKLKLREHSGTKTY